MLRRGHRSLRLPRIDHDDLRMIFVLANALPHDWMRNAKVRTDEHEHIGFLEIFVGIRWRIEAERLFVSRGRGCHALTGVAVAVKHPHTELCERAEERQFLGANLACTEPSNSVVDVFVLDSFLSHCGELQRRASVYRL